MILKWFQWVLIVFLFEKYMTLPEYHQNDYDVQIERVEIIWYNTSFARDVHLNYGFYNRSQKVFNGSAYLLVNISTDVTGTAEFFKFASNEYRNFPMKVGCNLCHEFAKNNFNIREMLQRVSNVKPCPAPKGYYYVHNLVMNDFSRLPPYIPRGRYKAVGKLYYKSKFVGEAHGYGAVVDKPLKWNK